MAQAQVLDGFSWVDLKSDTDTVTKVSHALAAQKYTALREIGVAGEHALVITTLRANPTADPDKDTFTAWDVWLKYGQATELLSGTSLRYIDWQKLYDYGQPELLAYYNDCADCQATTFLTAFYQDRKTHAWAARWPRQRSAAPLYSAAQPGVQHVYALFMNVDQRVVLDTWSHYAEQKRASRGGDYFFEYKIDTMSGQEMSRPVTGREADAMKLRLCKADNVVFGIAGGQDSSACPGGRATRAESLPKEPMSPQTYTGQMMRK
jgi:hypothetical protein